ncbi:MAG TPA: hypothetical protein VLH39_06960 [Magnetospirillaceae bacterium]|nr:hypothetical protein [Magnetospirillaceae bacterium]
MERIGSDRSQPARGAAEIPGQKIPGLRTGASVLFEALYPGREGRWTVLINGQRLEAAVSVALERGMRYLARAEPLPDRPGWALRVLGPADFIKAADFLRASGLPGDPVALMALRALMAEALSLDPRNLARLRNALLRRGRSEDSAEFLARALAKGLEPEALARALDPAGTGREYGGGADSGGADSGGADSGGADSGGADSGGAHSDCGSGGRRTPGRDAPPDGGGPGFPQTRWQNFPAPLSDSGGNLADLLRHLVSRTSDNANPYQLFNAMASPGGRWVYVPYRFERGGVAFSGTLRILIPESGPSSAVVAADATVEYENGGSAVFDFSVRPGASGFRLSLSTSSDSARPGLERGLRRLEESLAGLACTVQDGTVESSDSPIPCYRPVDENA